MAVRDGRRPEGTTCGRNAVPGPYPAAPARGAVAQIRLVHRASDRAAATRDARHKAMSLWLMHDPPVKADTNDRLERSVQAHSRSPLDPLLNAARPQAGAPRTTTGRRGTSCRAT